MEFHTFDEFVKALVGGRVLAGDIVYVAPELYRTFSESQRGWLWQHAIEARARLVTDLDVDPPIVVHRGGPGGTGVSPADALQRR